MNNNKLQKINQQFRAQLPRPLKIINAEKLFHNKRQDEYLSLLFHPVTQIWRIYLLRLLFMNILEFGLVLQETFMWYGDLSQNMHNDSVLE